MFIFIFVSRSQTINEGSQGRKQEAEGTEAEAMEGMMFTGLLLSGLLSLLS